MRNKIKVILKLIIPSIVVGSCNVNLNPKGNRILIVEEKKINDSDTFFWFRETGQITHESISYFQIAKNRCSVSVKNADAYCNDPVQVYDIKNDTVFVLAISEIMPMKKSENIAIRRQPYSNELFDVAKKPDRTKQYFLDSLCKN